ncbi:MAG: DUF4199 domain-containing protein [Bacteroidaceae bacterium]|nr:DUF4199 domain-containing protein [Bacteroidaceae bacterium]
MQENSIKATSEKAMSYGTILGAVAILTNIFYLIGLKSPLFSTLFITLFAATPIIAARLAIIYRKRERDNRMTLAEAWFFLMIMFACAALLSSVAQLIYFLFIDGGYFMSIIQEQFDAIINMEGADARLKEQFSTTAEILKSLSPRNMVLQILGTNLLFSPIITFIIAIFVKKSPK